MTDNQSFKALGLTDALCHHLNNKGFIKPTPVQKDAIPLLMSGHDVIVQAQTGSGKTASFALPVMELIQKNNNKPQCLILTPTRELALQVSQAFKELCHLDRHQMKVTAIYGGDDYKRQLKDLKQGTTVIVGTPGRVMDHIRRGTLDLSGLNHLVLDEADEMLRMGFLEDVEWILSHVPQEKQMALFSATMPQAVKKIAKTFLRDPVEVIKKEKTMTVASINQSFIITSFANKTENLLRVLESHTHDGVICFARTREDTLQICDQLTKAGLKAQALNGDIAQAKRKRTIDAMKSGAIDIIVATDVAARGIDIERVSLVINYDMPFDHETYVHRVGRTGRAGRKGDAILFVTPREERSLKNLQQHLNITISPYKLASLFEVHANKMQALKKNVLDVIRDKDLHIQKQLIKECLEMTDKDSLDIAASLLFLWQGNKIKQPKEQKAEVFSFSDKKRRSKKLRGGLSRGEGERGGRGRVDKNRGGERSRRDGGRDRSERRSRRAKKG